jgi:hypothetical protein
LKGKEMTILSASFASLSLSRRCSFMSDSERQQVVAHAIMQMDTEDVLTDLLLGVMDGEAGLPHGLHKRLADHIEQHLCKSNAMSEFIETSARRAHG